jgi:hypothetical protein
MSRKLISFDWAMKKILRQKANFTRNISERMELEVLQVKMGDTIL